MQRQRDAALRDGRARFISQKTRSGKNKRRFRWIEQPSKQYLKTLKQLRKVEQTRQDSMRGYQHRVSHQLVRDPNICIEDTKTANMTRSAKGTTEEPGTNVRQKAGLNRSILAQGWYGTRTKIEYKSDWYGRQFVPVPPAHTSQRCSKCNYMDAGNRVPNSLQVPKLRLPIKRRRQRSRKYPAPRSVDLGQGRRPAWAYRRRPSWSTSATQSVSRRAALYA